MNRTTSIITSILLSTLIVDTITANVYDLISKELASSLGVAFFIVNSAILLGSELFLLLGFVKHKTGRIRTADLAFDKLYRLVIVIQIILIAIFVFMSIQIVLTSQYFIVWIIVGLIISSIPFYVSFGLLAKRFFIWYRSNKRNLIVFLYCLGVPSTLVGTALIDIGLYVLFLDSPMVIESSRAHPQNERSTTSHSFPMKEVSDRLLGLATVILIIDYILLWTASAVLLFQYSRRLGKSTIYWMIIFLPLAFTLIGIFPTLLGVSTADFPFFEQDMILFRIITTLAVIGGALLFGAAFFTIAKTTRRIKQDSVSDYLNLAGFGIALMIITIVGGLVLIPYPPFAIAASFTAPLASYLFYIGVYSSAISISEDTELRRSIRKMAVNELKLLDSIGRAQMNQQLQDKVAKLVKKYSDKLNKDVGIQPNLPEEDAKQYLDEVMKELDKHRQ
jgi:hypothetical protein